MVKFLNFVPWAGLMFCYTPNQIVEIDEDIATAREAAGLGRVVKDKTKPHHKKDDDVKVEVHEE